MLQKTLFIILSFSIFSCKKTDKNEFGRLTNEFIQNYAHFFPDESPLSKDNSLLTQIHIPTVGNLDSVSQFHAEFTDALEQFDVRNFDEKASLDHQKMKKILGNVAHYLTECGHNPAYFDVRYGFERILHGNYADAHFRLQTLFAKLAHVPHFYREARERLLEVDPKFIDPAVEAQIKTFHFFDETLPKAVKMNGAMTPQYQARLDEAKLEIKDYVAHLESLKLN